MKSDQIPRIAHDPDVFEAFYREYVNAVQRFVVRRVGDPHLAADLTADIFLAAIDGAPGYDPRRGEPTGWLFGVARNVVSAELRRSARAQRLHSRIEGRRLLEDDDIGALVDRIDAERETRELMDAYASLPEGERAVLELVGIDGLSVAEAASALGIRAVTARVRLHRARAPLRDESSRTTPSAVAANLEAS